MAVCRTCLKTTTLKDVIPLFDGGLLPFKIEVISSVKIKEEEDLPMTVCTRCALNINLAYQFRQLVINSDLKLHENIVTTIDTSTEMHDYKDCFEDTDLDEALLEEEIVKSDALESEEPTILSIDKELPLDDIEIMLMEDIDTSHPIRINTNKLHKCKKCDFQTTKYKEFYYHKSTHHKTVTSVLCSICGKSLQPQSMRKHILIHYSSPISCNICGNVCKNSESLRCHMMYHKGEEKVCHICGKVYIHSSKYSLHIRRHMTPKQRIHQCNLCDKAFNEKETLKKHIRSHTGEKPYPCEVCKKGFSSSHALKTHKRQHTKEKPYSCTICSMAFTQRVSLRTHMKTKHNVEDIHHE